MLSIVRMEASIPSWRQRRATDFRRFRINLIYLWRHGHLPDLANPQTFTEHVQYRKLHEHDMRMPPLADKLAVKQIMADRIGLDWIIPTLWQGEELPPKPGWPTPFVVKARHGCNQTAFVFDEADWQAVRRQTKRWMAREYGIWLDEWLYRHIPRGLLIEPYVGEPSALPLDYKFYVFGGRVELVQVHLDRAGRHRWMLFDRNWRRVSSPTSDNPPPPQSLTQMIEAAEELGRDFDFIRVDLYQIGGKPRFGEISFYPGSGLDPFDPPSLDAVIGEHWTRAKQARAG